MFVTRVGASRYMWCLATLQSHAKFERKVHQHVYEQRQHGTPSTNLQVFRLWKIYKEPYFLVLRFIIVRMWNFVKNFNHVCGDKNKFTAGSGKLCFREMVRITCFCFTRQTEDKKYLRVKTECVKILLHIFLRYRVQGFISFTVCNTKPGCLRAINCSVKGTQKKQWTI